MSQPRGRTITQRTWNVVRGPIQSQEKKDAELIKSVVARDYNRVLKYLGRGAKVTEDTLRDLIERIRDISNTRRRLRNITFGEMHEDIQIFKALTNKYKTTNYSSMVPIAEEALRFRQEEKERIDREIREEQQRREATRTAMDAEMRAYEEGRAAARHAARAAQEAEWAAVLAVEEERRARQGTRGNDAQEVHKEFKKVGEKVPIVLEVIKRDLGNTKEYSDIETIFEPLYTYVKTNPAFKSRAINSIQVKNPNGKMGPKILSRAEWISDLDRVKEGVGGSYEDKIVQMGLIFDFIIKHTEITDCFIAGFIHDCTHAYSNGHLSCYMGILERTITTLINCMKGMNEGVFGELHKIIEDNIESWDELDKGTQGAYIITWNEFLIKWSQRNAEVGDIKGMNPAERSEAVMVDFKKEENVPKYVEDHIRAELFPGLTEGVWSDYGFNSPAGVGGRRRKTKRHRKNNAVQILQGGKRRQK